MFTAISQKITDRLLDKDVIKHEDYEIYQYGMEQLLMNLLNLLTVLILGVMLEQVCNALIFVLGFVSLRRYSGGFHAATPLKCYVMTTVVITAALSVIKYVKINTCICLFLTVLSGGVILLLSPVESKNKPLDKMEKIIYARKAIIIWCIETMIAISPAFFLMNEIGKLGRNELGNFFSVGKYRSLYDFEKILGIR